MPSFVDSLFNSYFKRIFQIDQSSNTGVDSTSRSVLTGDGAKTALSLSDDAVAIRPQDDDTTTTFSVSTQAGNAVMRAGSSTQTVTVGANLTNALTLFKTMGLYDFSPLVGYHYPLIANTMFVPTGATAFAADSDWGNGTDPATTLDVSGLTAQENAVAVYWFIEQNITLDVVRFMATADASDALNFHLFSYTLDTSSDHGDLSAGVVNANASVAATDTTIKTGTFTLDEADIDANKVVVGFVESDSTTDLTVALNIQYHIR